LGTLNLQKVLFSQWKTTFFRKATFREFLIFRIEFGSIVGLFFDENSVFSTSNFALIFDRLFGRKML